MNQILQFFITRRYPFLFCFGRMQICVLFTIDIFSIFMFCLIYLKSLSNIFFNAVSLLSNLFFKVRFTINNYFIAGVGGLASVVSSLCQQGNTPGILAISPFCLICIFYIVPGVPKKTLRNSKAV